ncbi:MAG: hypothetical protein HZB43_12805 [candidate division Zixibacteria bacterium]|nr:hypothetical protein [candidate division Zixibacteria bacterium]
MPEASQFIYRIQPTRPAMLTEGPTPEEEAIITEHFEYLKRLTEEDVALAVGRTMTTDVNAFGIVIFLADSEMEARRIMENDAAVKKGVMKAELFPFRIALLHDGWRIPGDKV